MIPNTMYSILVLLSVVVVVVSADVEDDMKKCKRLFEARSHHCCKRAKPMKPNLDYEAMKECHQLQGNPPSCDREICFAEKRGIASSDGKINKEGLKASIESDFEGNPEAIKLIQDNCADGDISKYGKPDMCDVMKLKICMLLQLASTCPEWDGEGDCAGLKELVDECSKNFA